jgi:hypothetical protein
MSQKRETRRALLAGATGLGNLSYVAADGFENKPVRPCAQAKSRANLADGWPKIDFDAINQTALRVLPTILKRLVPDGEAVGHEYTALNPTRADRHAGSFKINLRSGRWADFATGDKGGDPVSLCAYVEGVSQSEAARRLARMLGLDTREGRRHG